MIGTTTWLAKNGERRLIATTRSNSACENSRESLAHAYPGVVHQNVDPLHAAMRLMNHRFRFRGSCEIVQAPGSIRCAGLPAQAGAFLQLALSTVGGEVDRGAL
jgi:hypothetical protein